jgi:ATP-dependent exoDNAse (exonuclease V) beta subunit
MQSIYGFRQAEVRAFLELAETGIGSLRFELERLESNFRAQASLIEWVNATFSRILPARDDRARGAIAFRPSRPAGGGSRATGTEACGAGTEVCGTGAAGDEPPVLLRSFSSPRAEARAIAASIKARAQRHPHWRIAVLVRARAHAQPVAQALRESGIAFEAVDVEPLIERPAVRDVLTLLRALLHPADRIAWLGLLRSPWVGLRLADLLTVSRARGLILEALGDELLLAQLSEEGRERCSKVRLILESAFEARARHGLARWLEATWLALGGAAGTSSALDLEHVRVFLERVALLEQRGVPDSADLEESFAELCVPSSLESSRPQGGEGGTPAAGRIEIMTIHKAKGLEFDCVFVPALERPTRSGSNELLLTHEFARTGRDGLVMAARPPVAADDRGLFDFLRTQVREAAALESQRLLYVACTRAKCELHLTATIESLNGTEEAETDESDAESVPASSRQPFRPWPGSLLDILWPVARDAFALARIDPLSAVASPVERGTAASAPTLSLLRLPLEWRAPAPADPGLEPPASMLEREDAPPFDWVGETARRVGTLVHAELERLQPSVAAPELLQARAKGYRRWLMLRGVPEEHLDAAAARVVEALLAVQSDERGRWILTPRAREDYREHALSGPVGGETQRAVFDRCFVEDGVRWVIDYKTSEHRGGGLEAFLDREVERYRAQLERYAELARRLGPEPVRVGLYFPLMRAWREWNPAPALAERAS